MKLAIWAAIPLFCTAALSGCGSPAPELVPLTIKSGQTTHHLKVEFARTQDQQDLGLANRSSIPSDGGMLFPMVPPCDAGFWMKDMDIPLDMVFIRTNGTILRIAERAAPHSHMPIYPGEAVGAVLEIAGGKANQLGLAAGDQVSWNQSGTVTARSSCATSKRE